MFSHGKKSARGLVKHCKTQLSFNLSFTIVHNTHSYMKDLLKLNREQSRWVVWLFTGHCHLKAHLFEMGLTDDPTCEWCLENDESATHILCDLRFCHLWQFFMEPSDYYGCPHKQSPTFHSKCRIDKRLIKEGEDNWRSHCKGQIIMAQPLCIHSFIHLFIHMDNWVNGKLTFAELIRKLCSYGTWSFSRSTVFTKAIHWNLHWAGWI
jgi:hypothetical protein